MEKYRKHDQYYIDMYDRATIQELKIREVEEQKHWATIPEEEKWVESIVSGLFSNHSFRNSGIWRSRNKGAIIGEQMAADERKDKLVLQHSIPQNVRCNTCQSLMSFSTPIFKESDTQIIFVFECPNQHGPRKALYPDGREYMVPKPVCRSCGGDLQGTSQERSSCLIFMDTCVNCGEVTVDEWEIKKDPVPIDEAEREKYCIAFNNHKTQWEELEPLLTLISKIDLSAKERKAKELLALGKIEKLTVYQMQKRITSQSELPGFSNLLLDKPEFKQGNTVVSFTMQDTIKRKGKKSISSFKTFFQEVLLSTNWRVFRNSVSYQVGYLSGKLQCYELENDLIRIAEEIIEKGK